MKQKKYLVLLGAMLALVACGGPGVSSSSQSQGGSNCGEYTPYVCPEDFGYASLSERERKSTYETYLSVMPTTLNYTKTMQAENASHIANFVDGLVEHDRFGNLVPCLATNTGTPNADFTEWQFELDSSKNSVWVDSTGKEYGKVTPEDFKSILKIVLHASTASESAYLPLLIIQGAEEYVEATRLWYQTYKDTAASAKYTFVGRELRKILGYVPTNEEIDQILAFEKVGVVTTDTTITYKLTNSADYFPTMLTYLPFLPLNEKYYNEIGAVNFGAAKNILFNGAYLLEEREDSRMVYTKNNTYWDADNVKTTKVIYKRLGENLPKDFARTEYEAGKIDGFTLNSFDTVGWDKYVKGVDCAGTILDPHHELTYSSENLNVDSSFMFYLNLNRPTSNPSKLTSIKSTDIANANKAIKYSYFRDAIYDSLDLNMYNARNGQDVFEQQQTQINTYIPKNFVSDNNGKDYFDYLLDAYQSKHNVTREEAEANLNPGIVVQKSLDETVAQLQAAVAQLAIDEPTISYPITIEYASFYGDTDQQTFDSLFIEATNERLNGCIIDENYYYPNEENMDLRVCNANEVKVKIVPNTKILSTQNYLTVSATFDYTLFISGWGPDYGDPMTYAHTVVQGGDLADYMGITENATHFSAETQALFDTYGQMVEEANAIVSSTSAAKQERFKKFAEAEIFMLEEMAIMKPLYQSGQGFSCSISNFIPYRSPRSGYGLSSSKLKGMEILTAPLKGCERQRLRAEWDRQKAEQDI